MSTCLEGLPSSPVPSGVKALRSQRAEKTGHSAYRGWAPSLEPSAIAPQLPFLPAAGLKAGCLPFSRDPAGGPREHLNTGVQQLLEEKEQALAILQETVQVW